MLNELACICALCVVCVCCMQVIVEKVVGARIADLDRKKYLVPGDLTGE